MTDSRVPPEVAGTLADDRYLRRDATAASEALARLGTRPGSLIHAFFTRYEGPFWSEGFGAELLDVAEEGETVETATMIGRTQLGLAASDVVLTRYLAGQVVILNTTQDRVYEVDFEGGDRLYRAGELAPRWDSFRAFLVEYFVGGQ